jgi:streptogramin lyase
MSLVYWVVWLAACASLPIRPSARLSVLSPDNRTVISDFSYVTALAASSWLVFAATPHGLMIYDRATRRFRPPVTALDGYPAGRVRRAIADPSGNAVWLDLGGSYTRYDVDGRAWSGGLLPSGLFDRTLTVESALANAPMADALRTAILTDSRLRVHQFTAAASTPDRTDIFFGTNGLGVVRVDKQTGEWEVLSYGLIAAGVGAIALVREGIWSAANTRPGERGGLTWIANDLSRTRSSEGGGAALGFSFLQARHLVAAGDQLWLATEQGVLRIDTATFRSTLFDVPEATSLARADSGIWVGTVRGLVWITPDNRVSPVGSTHLSVTSLLTQGDVLWVGTTAGLGQMLPGSDAVTAPPELVDQPSARVTVYALARLQDTLVIATDRELRWRNPTTHAWGSLPLPLNIGVPTALASDSSGTLWVGGTEGLAQVDLARAFVHVHTAPLEIPAAVRDLAADRDYLWVATDSGLVRIQ